MNSFSTEGSFYHQPHVKVEEFDDVPILDFFQDDPTSESGVDTTSISSSSWSCASPSLGAMRDPPFNRDIDDVYHNIWQNPPFVEDPSKAHLKALVKLLQDSLVTEVSQRQVAALQLQRQTQECAESQQALQEANDRLKKMKIRRRVYLRTIKQFREQSVEVNPRERRKLQQRLEELEQRLSLKEGRESLHVKTKMQAQFDLMIQENLKLSQEVESLHQDLSFLSDEGSIKRQKLV